MKHNLTKPCPECPYVGKWQGWIGGHETAQDFVDYARADQPFPCHSSLDQEAAESVREQVSNGEGQQCAGQLLFMNRMCKLSRNPEMAKQQKILKETCNEQVLWPPDRLVEHHGG